MITQLTALADIEAALSDLPHSDYKSYRLCVWFNEVNQRWIAAIESESAITGKVNVIEFGAGNRIANALETLAHVWKNRES